MPNSGLGPPPPDSRLTLTTLGGASLERVHPDRAVKPVLGPGKPLALLAYLALSPGRTANRQHLVDLLWSDVHPKAGDHCFRQTLSYLRQRLGEDAYTSHEGNVALAAAIQSDRDAFLEAVERGDLDCAVALYRGEFLPGFATPGGADFEQWADVERHRLRLTFMRAAEALARHHLSSGRFRDAQKLARRVRDADPLDERGWRLLLEGLLSGKDDVAAALEADALEQLLRAEEREPEPATRTVLELARQGPSAGEPERAGARPLVADLIGREPEFSAIIAAWEATRRGHGSHVHLRAAAGLGKTRLLGDVHARLRAAGARVVALRANAGERHLDYAFGSDLAAGLCKLPGATSIAPATAATLVALNPALSAQFATPAERAADAETLRRRTIALSTTVSAVADEAPVTILIDDVHWADAPSRQVLQGIVDKVAEWRVLVVTTARPVPEGAIETQDTSTLVLEPLSPAEVGALVSSLGTVPDEPWARSFADAVHAAAAGSPLLVLETLQLLIENGALAHGETGWTCSSPVALAAELGRGGALRHRVEGLDRPQGWLLLLLATAGTPLSGQQLAQAAGHGADAVQGDLAALEQRGLVARAAGEFEPAHDEIARLAIECAPPEELRAAHEALGELLAGEPDQPAALLRSAQHFALGGKWDRVGDVFARSVVLARRRGDRRSLRALATEALGEARSQQRARSLVLGLPLGVRARLVLRSPIAVAGATIAAAAVAAALLLGGPEAPPDALLLVTSLAGEDSGSSWVVPIRRRGWELRDRVNVAEGTVRVATNRLPPPGEDAVPSPDGTRWAVTRLAPDSGEQDIFLLDKDGRERRLSFFRFGDHYPSWSPDGRRLAFMSAHWNPNQWSDIAIVDLVTGFVHRLAAGFTPAWSPDGSRIAFVPRKADGRSSTSSFCWITPDARRERCFAFSPDTVVGPVLGWRGADEVLLEVGAAGGSFLLRLDVETGRRFASLGDGTHMVSPDGHWGACFCRRGRRMQPEWIIAPVAQPELALPLEAGRGVSSYALRWLPVAASQAYIERVEILAPPQGIPLDARHRLAVRASDAQGRPVSLPSLLTWSVADTTIAAVGESTGVVVPRRLGHVMVRVSLGGWRTDSVRVAIRPPGFDTILVESWTEGLTARWVPFGDPLPAVTTGPGGKPALWSRSDDYFNSGVYSRQRLDGSRGLGFEVEMSTPLNAVQWQYWGLELTSRMDSAALAAWDHRTGGVPERSLPGVNGTCSVTLPWGIGEPARQVLSMSPGDARGARLAPVERWMASGRWYRFRVQLFPDGTCGFALEGRPLSRSEGAIPLARSFRLIMGGKSVGTRMLVGRVLVWSGIRGDVDWSLLDRDSLPPTRPASGSSPRARGPATRRR